MKHISGSKLMSMSQDEIDTYKYKIIHQTWKSENISSENRFRDFKSWGNFHKDALQVLWTDIDNNVLIQKYYPEFKKIYDLLYLPVQKVDLTRLLYLHKYGGLYVDLDYEAYTNLFEKFKNLNDWLTKDIFIVKSPFLINEVFQNSLMLSKTKKNEFWYECAESIKNIILFIHNKAVENKKYSKYKSMKFISLFHLPFIKKYINMLYTVYITGPGIVDKTYVKTKMKNKLNIGFLDTDLFYSGKYAKHHQANSWVKGLNITKLCCLIIQKIRSNPLKKKKKMYFTKLYFMVFSSFLIQSKFNLGLN